MKVGDTHYRSIWRNAGTGDVEIIDRAIKPKLDNINPYHPQDGKPAEPPRHIGVKYP